MDSNTTDTAQPSVENHINIFIKPAIIIGTMACAVVGGIVAAPLIVPATLGTVGFSATGVVGGTIAASLQASIGNVVAGSTFAACQSMAMGGAITTAATAATAASAGATGGLLGFIGTCFWRGRKKQDKRNDEDEKDNKEEPKEDNVSSGEE